MISIGDWEFNWEWILKNYGYEISCCGGLLDGFQNCICNNMDCYYVFFTYIVFKSGLSGPYRLNKDILILFLLSLDSEFILWVLVLLNEIVTIKHPEFRFMESLPHTRNLNVCAHLTRLFSFFRSCFGLDQLNWKQKVCWQHPAMFCFKPKFKFSIMVKFLET